MSQSSVLVLYAHPYPDRSRAGRALLSAVRALPGVTVRSLYDLYPDFAIDAEREKEALLSVRSIVWQCPFYWYGVPSLLGLWFEKVLEYGWAYGSGGTALHGKRLLWVTTTGAPVTAYQRGAMHGHPFESFVPAIEQTARFCGMEWEDPLVVHGAHRLSDDELASAANDYRHRVEALVHDARRLDRAENEAAAVARAAGMGAGAGAGAGAGTGASERGQERIDE